MPTLNEGPRLIPCDTQFYFERLVHAQVDNHENKILSQIDSDLPSCLLVKSCVVMF